MRRLPRRQLRYQVRHLRRTRAQIRLRGRERDLRSGQLRIRRGIAPERVDAIRDDGPAPGAQQGQNGDPPRPGVVARRPAGGTPVADVLLQALQRGGGPARGAPATGNGGSAGVRGSCSKVAIVDFQGDVVVHDLREGRGKGLVG